MSTTPNVHQGFSQSASCAALQRNQVWMFSSLLPSAADLLNSCPPLAVLLELKDSRMHVVNPSLNVLVFALCLLIVTHTTQYIYITYHVVLVIDFGALLFCSSVV